MTERINGKALRRYLAAAREQGEIDWGVSEETFQAWKANSGNAKARRRWRRRNVPNSQRPSSNMAAQCMAAWAEADGAMSEAIAKWQAEANAQANALAGRSAAIDAKAEHFGDWANGSTWAPGIWAAAVPLASVGTAGEPTMRVTKVDREAREITMEALP